MRCPHCGGDVTEPPKLNPLAPADPNDPAIKKILEEAEKRYQEAQKQLVQQPRVMQRPVRWP